MVFREVTHPPQADALFAPISRRSALQLGLTAAIGGTALAAVARLRPYERLAGLDLIAGTGGAPADVGQWTAPFPGPDPVVAVHGVMLRTGSVLMVEGRTAYVWDPVTGARRRVDPPNDLFCAGQTHLADGTVLFVGGYLGPQGENIGPPWNHTFDPVNLTWTRRANSRRGRWYPTATRLPNGKVLITGGTDEETNPNTDIDLYSNGKLKKIGSRSMEFYPLQHVVPNGRVVSFVPDTPGTTYFINPSKGTLTPAPAAGMSKAYAASVLLPGGVSGSSRVMVLGGADHLRDSSGTYTAPHAATQVLDAAHPGAGWRPKAPLPEPRIFANVVILPDGSLLVVGGENAGVPVRRAALYDPAADTWRILASQTEMRRYHSIAVLLPDGRVLSGGDNFPGGGADTLEVFSPPYLFRGPRPLITSAPASVAVTASLSIGVDGAVRRAVLMAPAATTHSCDMNQRHVELAFTAVSGGIEAKVPGKTVAIPGYYMLFVLNADGVPSVARWIRVTA